MCQRVRKCAQIGFLSREKLNTAIFINFEQVNGAVGEAGQPGNDSQRSRISKHYTKQRNGKIFSFEKLVQSLFLTQFLKTKFNLDLARH